MRIPKRKAEEWRQMQQDDGPLYLTQEGLEKLKRTYERIKKSLPAMREELTEAREMGDLSENAGYQIAKANLRRAQNRILSIEEKLKRVVVIQKNASLKITLGSTITVSVNGQEFTYELVGPAEANPLKGRISHLSPIGSALMGHLKDDVVFIELPAGQKQYTILDVQ